MKETKAKKIKNLISTLEFILLISIVIGIPAYVVIFQKELLEQLTDMDYVVGLINDNLSKGSFIYLGIMCLQIVISVLPGQVIQTMAGYVFPPVLAIILSIIGTIIGSTLTYYIAKLLGKDFIHMIFGEEKMENFTRKLNSKKAYIIVFLIYLIPGIPKDMMGYAAGISSMDYPLFILTSTIGRIPGIVGCVIIGQMTYNQNYTGAIIIGIVATILFILGLIYKNQINNWLEKRFEILQNNRKK